MRHEPSVSAQNPDLHLIFSLQFLLLLSQSIDKYYSKPTSELPACMCAKEASTCPLLHRRGAIDLADFRQSIAGLLFLLFHIFFFFSHVYLLSFTPPLAPLPIAIKCYRLEQGNATCRGEMYVPCCGFWR